MNDFLLQFAAQLVRHGHREIAVSLPDALWLAGLLAPESPQEEEPAPPEPDRTGRTRTAEPDDSSVEPSGDEPVPPRPVVATPPAWRIETLDAELPGLRPDRLPVGMLVPRGRGLGQPARHQHSLKLLKPPGLSDPNEYGRRLKPLRRFRRNPRKPLLDVARTVERICDEKIWDLVVRYPYDRCLNLTWIIDGGGSMHLWRQIASELYIAFRDSGAFRSCRAFRWDVDQHWQHSFILLDAQAGKDAGPSRRDWPEIGLDGLVVIFSVCSAGRWYREETRRALSDLGRQAQLLIVNPLPEHMWGPTVLGQAVEADMRSPMPGAPAHRLQRCGLGVGARDSQQQGDVRLLAVSADPDHLLGWSRFVAGQRPVYPGFSLDIDVDLPPPAFAADEGDAQQRLDRFRRYASRGARELARVASAVPLLTPRLIQLVRERMVAEEFKPSHLHEAELLLSPLLQQVGEEGPDCERVYDFYPGVRQRLLEQTSTEHIRRVFHYFVDIEVRADLDRTSSLGEYGVSLAELDAPDADCEVHRLSEAPTELILRRLGGEYRRFLKDARKSSLQLELNSHLRQAQQAHVVGDHEQALAALDQAQALLDADPQPWGDARVLVDEWLRVYRGLLRLPKLVAEAHAEAPPTPGPFRVRVTGKLVVEAHAEAGAERAPFVEPVTGMELAPITAGSFLMGSPEGEPERNEGEVQHRVTVSHDFWMGIHPVTHQQYQALMKKNPSQFKGENRPVENVTWHDAVEFCQRLTERAAKAGILPEGYVFRLPTEAEWEYCCRAGTKTATAFSNQLSSHQANFHGNYPYGGAEEGPFLEQTSDVGSYPPNPWGLYDMHGNVREWCLDAAEVEGVRVKTDTYVEDVVDPQCQVGRYRVYRGGGWRGYGRNCRSAYRYADEPGSRNGRLGFRVCLARSPGRSSQAADVTETGS